MADESKVSDKLTSDTLPISTTTAAAPKLPRKLGLIPLIFLIYFEVAGGPFGEEPAVKAAGPRYALLGFLIFPFIWSVPEALITAELSTAFPGNGGFVVWADSAFGPFIGSLMGSLKFLSTVINMAAFPVLMIDYLKSIFHVLSFGWPRKVAILSSTMVLSFLNYTGLAVVGWVSVALGVVSLMPFIILTIMAIPMIRPKRWVSSGQKGVKKDWNLFFNTLFWNLNFFDSVSTLAGEVEKPHKTFPLGLLSAVILTCVSYLAPLFAVTGAVSVDQSLWVSGFHAQAAHMIAGQWLKIWIEVGAVLSGMGLYEAQMSSCAYQIEGMARMGLLPKFCGVRSKWFNTPWVAILFSTVITLSVSFMSFTDIIASANFLYSMAMLLEFASFLWLRWKRPDLERPFQVPGGLSWLVVMCLVPSVFLVMIMSIATKMVYLVSGLMTAGAIGWYFLMEFLKKKEIFKFNTAGDDK